MTVIVEMRGISKSFPGVQALDGVDLTLHEGEILGLMGENGAGKSTLMNILGGIYPPDTGTITINGRPTAFGGVEDITKRGIAFIHQELALENYLTIAENIFLGREVRNSAGLVSQRRMEEEAKQYLELIGLDFKPSTKVFRLSTGQQQMIEIARALSLHANVIVMDEPTSSLSEREVKILFDVVRSLREQGIAVIYISHKMAEIFELTDNVMVLRDGQYITTLETAKTNEDELISAMVGRELGNYYTRNFREPGEVALKAEHITRGEVVQDCSFEVRRGEILGFYGLIGAGRSELIKAMMGLDPGASGNVAVFGKPIRTKAKDMVANRVILVPEDRKVEGLFLYNTVAFNISISMVDKFIGFLRVDHAKERQIVSDAIAELDVKTPSMNQQVRNLSGGNQQKVVLSKWLVTDPEVLIMDEPTRGIDVGAKAEIYRIMNDLVQQGKAIVLVSSEMNEVINMSDRIAVMAGGRIVKTLEREDFDPDVILAHAIGGAR
ncbi:MAG: sugar ABC transporter ATP-binding protein [Propionibacteriaceae bacterium]|jgi:ribose transport system ATP-binding protein/inositol transport system ATP-binding protein|nr:sugar ABC transporter ATP-binding protein [Propionibacteriaceae bacterium]